MVLKLRKDYQGELLLENKHNNNKKKITGTTSIKRHGNIFAQITPQQVYMLFFIFKVFLKLLFT